MALDRELAVFRALLPSLLPAHEGEYVVIKGDELSGIQDTYEDALKVGYARFGPVPFLVKQILAVETVLHFGHDFPAPARETPVIPARDELRRAIQPFVDFLVWMDASQEIGEAEFTDDSCVNSLTVGGGSTYLWVHQFRRLKAVWEKCLPGPDSPQAETGGDDLG